MRGEGLSATWMRKRSAYLFAGGVGDGDGVDAGEGAGSMRDGEEEGEEEEEESLDCLLVEAEGVRETEGVRRIERGDLIVGRSSALSFSSFEGWDTLSVVPLKQDCRVIPIILRPWRSNITV